MNTEKEKNIIDESMEDILSYTKVLKEGTSQILSSILKEHVEGEFKKLINESEFNDIDDDKKDTDSETDVSISSDQTNDSDTETTIDVETETDTESNTDEFSSDESEGDEFAEFEKYKVGDDTYDMVDATEEEAVKIFKLLKDDDQIVTVKRNGDTINIKDNETGSEYMIQTSGNEFDSENIPQTDTEDEVEYEINESVLQKILESNGNLGYTTSYQEKTAMTTGGVKEPGKNVNDWDKGVPTSGDDTRRWGKQGENDPFDKTVKEETEVEEQVESEDANVEEGGLTRTKRNLRQTASVKAQNQVDNNQGKRVDQVRQGAQLENRLKESQEKYTKLLAMYENTKKIIVDLRGLLQESALTQLKLVKAVDLMTENSTTSQEKINIIKRFDEEAKTKEDVERLYESINKTLKGSKQDLSKSLNENNTSLTATNNGETVLYENKELKDIRSLMDKLSNK